MDIAEFNMIRPLREADAEQVVRLSDIKVLVGDTDNPPMDDHMPPTEDRPPPLAKRMEVTWDTLPKKVGGKSTDPLKTTAGTQPSILERIYMLVGDLDAYLADHDDRVDGSTLETRQMKLLHQHHLDAGETQQALGGATDDGAIYPIALLGYRHGLIAALNRAEPDFDRAMRMTRRALVASLFEDSGTSCRTPGHARCTTISTGDPSCWTK